jgi:hypothetical protein
VLFMLSQLRKLSGVNMWPQSRMRKTR